MRHRLKSGLWKSDIFVKDKQNVKAATRILEPPVQHCMATWNQQRTIGTRTYLKIGQNMLSAEPNISIRERTQLAWSVVFFLRLWKAWINISGFKADDAFISDQTYCDFILSGRTTVDVWIERMQGSMLDYGDFVEENQISTLDMIELSGRIQKLKELKTNSRKMGVQFPPTAPNWNNIADKQILKTIESLGMLPKLQQRNVIRKEGDKLIYFNKAVETWIDSKISCQMKLRS